MIFLNLFGAITSVLVILQARRDNSTAFELFGVTFLALNLACVFGVIA